MLTDGANTYSVPNNDPAGNKSTYAAYGYMQPGYNGTGIGRLLTGTSVGQFDYSSSNYTAALDDHMAKLCDNAKAGNVLVMTVSLDLSTSDSTREQGDRGAEEMLVGVALPQGPGDRQACQAVLERDGQQPRREVQGNRGRTVEPQDRRLIMSALPAPQ